MIDLKCPHCGWDLQVDHSVFGPQIICVNYFACGAEWDGNGYAIVGSNEVPCPESA